MSDQLLSTRAWTTLAWALTGKFQIRTPWNRKGGGICGLLYPLMYWAMSRSPEMVKFDCLRYSLRSTGLSTVRRERKTLSEQKPIKVAVLGGGCAAMTAAFELTRPEHRGRFRVTVYQQGWRLGGKGASGRGPAGRIEEHGLHVWMGWY